MRNFRRVLAIAGGMDRRIGQQLFIHVARIKRNKLFCDLLPALISANVLGRSMTCVIGKEGYTFFIVGRKMSRKSVSAVL